MAERKKYVKGTVVQTLKTDAAGFPTDAIERDPDGYLWHVSGDNEPVEVRDDDEARAIAAESANKNEG